jgi:hypothetical protein
MSKLSHWGIIRDKYAIWSQIPSELQRKMLAQQQSEDVLQ